MSKLGIMQGRLLPKYLNHYQAHPVNEWFREFNLAQKLKLNYIEFIIDFDCYESNPLMTVDGLKKIMFYSENSGVKVESICADIFMQKPIFDNLYDKSELLAIFKKLLDASKELGIKDIVLPLVDKSSIYNCKNINDFDKIFNSILEVFTNYETNLCVETDLNPEKFYNFIKKYSHQNLTVNYDVGNSASLGFNVTEEFDAYGKHISLIHIKDRILNGPSVMLGNGNVNFDLFFNLLKKIKYKNNFTIQAFRDERDVEIFNEQFIWLKNNTEINYFTKKISE